MSTSQDTYDSYPGFPSVPSIDNLIALNEQVTTGFEVVVIELENALSKFDEALSGLGGAYRK